MKNKKIITGVIFILVVILFVVFQAGSSGSRQEKTGKPTSFSVGRYGFKAIFLLLGKIGYKTERWTKGIEDLKNEKDKGLIILSPFMYYIEKGDSQKLVEWTKQGNKLLISSVSENLIMKGLNVKIKEVPLKEKANPKGILSDNISTIEGLNPVRLVVDENKYNVLLKDEDGIICASIKYNEGEVIVFSSPEVFNNGNISRADNVILATNIIKYLDKDSIIMDESFHGIISNNRSFKVPLLIKYLMVQLIITLLFFYPAMMKRFGKPIVEGNGTIRTSTEYIYSLAGLFKKAKTTDFAIENCIRGFKRRLAKICRLSPEASDDKYIEAIRYISDVDEEEVRTLLTNCRAKIKDRNISPSQLEGLYQEMNKLADKIDSR